MKKLRIALVLTLAVAGCNSILDNQPGNLKQGGTATSKVDPNQPVAKLPNDGTPIVGGSMYDQPPAKPTTPDAGSTPAPASDAGACATGMHMCAGQCVSDNDPAYGCGPTTCTPCAIGHGTPACGGGACTVKVCDKGYADCNGKPDDGCETDLSKATSCGACNAVCPPATPVCAPVSDSFQCGTGCASNAPLLCGTECVDPLTSVNHCGGCGGACPVVANGEATCTVGHCGFTCHPTFHACGDHCASDTDATQCGAQCTVCPTPANATAICASDACSFTCAQNYGDCNHQPADGCEAAFLTDPLNCGGCGKSCNGGTCTNGVCSAPPPPDGGQ